MIITVNDIEEMRQAFAGLDMETLGIKYTVGQKPVQRRELLIRNWR